MLRSWGGGREGGSETEGVEEEEEEGSCRPAAERTQSRTRSALFPSSTEVLQHHTPTGGGAEGWGRKHNFSLFHLLMTSSGLIRGLCLSSRDKVQVILMSIMTRPHRFSQEGMTLSCTASLPAINV